MQEDKRSLDTVPFKSIMLNVRGRLSRLQGPAVAAVSRRKWDAPPRPQASNPKVT